MVYKLRSRYFISPARIMGGIKQEEQDMGFYTSSLQGPYLTTNCFYRRWKKKLSKRGGFSSQTQCFSVGLDSFSAWSQTKSWCRNIEIWGKLGHIQRRAACKITKEKKDNQMLLILIFYIVQQINSKPTTLNILIWNNNNQQTPFFMDYGSLDTCRNSIASSAYICIYSY